MPGFNMDDYVPVNERIAAFYEQHPEGSLQSEIVELTADRVTVKAYAYRSDEDPRPGIGHSSLAIPGSTSFTKGSEIENAETSAWGRAIAALGFEVKRGVATAEEVRNKQPSDGERADPARRGSRRPATTRPAAPRTPEETELLGQLLETGATIAQMELMADAIGVKKGEHANADQLREMLRRMTQPGSGVPDRDVPPAPAGGAGGSSVPPAPTDTPRSEGSPDPSASGSDAATGPAGAASPPVQPDPAPTLDDVLAVTGGELLPPKPGTDEYKRLPAPEKAAARAYWQSAEVTL
jgi:hypothetical protein